MPVQPEMTSDMVSESTEMGTRGCIRLNCEKLGLGRFEFFLFFWQNRVSRVFLVGFQDILLDGENTVGNFHFRLPFFVQRFKLFFDLHPLNRQRC